MANHNKPPRDKVVPVHRPKHTAALTVVALHVAGVAAVLAATHGHPGPIWDAGAAAWVLGLRHAFDADHIAAIDNTTRKLTADGQRPTTIGLFFALGHSTVVLVATIVVALGLTTFGQAFLSDGSPLRTWGAAVGGLTAGLFLIAVAVMNLRVLKEASRLIRSARTGSAPTRAEEDRLTARRGFLNRFFSPLLRRVDSPRRMYPLGVLFGLGFDTASAIALLAVTTAAATTSGAPVWTVVALPLVFAAAMAAGDTLDGWLMTRAYTWSTDQPLKRAYYTAAVTLISIVAAVGIGVPVIAGVLTDQFHVRLGVFNWLAQINLDQTGFILIAVFMTLWGAAAAFSRLKKRRPEN